MMKRTFRITIAGLVALTVLLWIISFATGSEWEPAPILQVTPGSEDAELLKLREQLQLPELSAEGRESLEEKLQIAERSATQQAEGAAAPRSTKNPPPPAAAAMVQAEPELFEGIFEGSEGLVRPSQADISNGWQGQHDGTYYQVFAGASVEEQPRGIIIVVTLVDDGPTGPRQMLVAPGVAQMLRIIQVDAGRLLLETDTGTQLSYDLSTKTFIE